MSSNNSTQNKPNTLHVEMEAISTKSSVSSHWEIKTGFTQTPFGEALIATSHKGICRLSFLNSENDHESQLLETQQIWHEATIIRDDISAKQVAKSIFESDKTTQSAPIKTFVRGTEFQLKVWRALLDIEHGTFSTYGEIAQRINSPKAYRAVGTAVGKNEISYLIPCHRVIQASGGIGGYRWGVEIKKSIISSEINILEG